MRAAVHTAPRTKWTARSLQNVRVACSGDIDEVVRLMHDAAAWMSAKGTPARDVARIDRTFAETFVLRSELLVAKLQRRQSSAVDLVGRDPEVPGPTPSRGGRVSAQARGATDAMQGQGVSSALIEARRHARAERRGCAKLRLDCRPNLRGLLRRSSVHPRRHFQSPAGSTFIAERLELEI